MPDLNAALGGLNAAAASLITTADAAASVWTVPRAPGKWSPSQVVEHVARIMEESANVVSGVPSKFPTIPFFIRPIVRVLMFKRILRRNAFLKMKTGEAFDPPSAPLTVALARFDQACRARAASGQSVSSTIFGSVRVTDFARFQELHVRHHEEQMPAK